MNSLQQSATSSQIAGWTLESPTPAQLKEFFAQIDSGRITKTDLQTFLRPTQPASHKIAREIMGKNMFGVKEACKYFGINASKTQLTTLDQIPWNTRVLNAYKDTHILVAMFPLSILDMKNLTKKFINQTMFEDDDWYEEEPFATDKGKVCWQFVRKIPIADTSFSSWNKQLAYLQKKEEVPEARTLIYTMVGHFLATGERLFEKTHVRTATPSLDDGNICVGNFDSDGLQILSAPKIHLSDTICLTSARK